MTNLSELRSWLFRALAVDQSLDELERDGVGVRPGDDPRALQRVLALEDFSSEIRRAAMRALPAYLGFFCIENAVRELVSERLAENHGADWWDECATTGMKSKVAGRQEKEGKNRWHARRGEHDVHYTDFGDLKNLIRNNWSDFEDLFPDQNWIAGRLDELEASRNIIAHSNVLEARELDRIRLHLEDWVRQVG